MASFRDPNIKNTKRHDVVDEEFAKRIVAAGEDRVALLDVMKGRTKTEVTVTLDWICSASSQNASIALAAANAVGSIKAQRAVADFIDLRSGHYSEQLVRQARKILEPKS